MERIKNIEELIMSNQLIEAALALKDIFQSCNEEELSNDSIVLLSKINNAKRKADQGVVDYFDPEFSKIRVSLVNMKSSAKVVLELNQNSKHPSTREEKRDTYKVVFEENFSDNLNNWPIYNNKEQQAIIDDRRYFITNFSSNSSRIYSIHKDVNENENFKIKSRVNYIRGDKTKGFGISWGESENGNGFRFIISSNGFFNIDYSLNKKAIDLKPWTKCRIINQGVKANVLEIVKNEEIIHFVINDKVVHVEPYYSFFGSRLGLFLGPNLEVTIDLFQIHHSAIVG